MRIQHKVNHGWAPNRNDPEWEERVEREAKATNDATEPAWRKAWGSPRPRNSSAPSGRGRKVK